MKKVISLALTITMLLAFTVIAIPAKKAEAETPLVLTMPENDGKTNKTSYVIGKGTEDQVTVTANFIPTSYAHRPGTTQTQKYIVVHNTDNWGSTANAKAHNTYLTTNSSVNASYAYIVGSDGIWQNMPDLENSWHTGNNTYGTNVLNSNAIGIETCDNGAPLASNGLPAWNTQNLYTWYENTFAQRVGYLAMLVATLCMRYDFNPYTQVVQHYDVYGKECPREMRYVFGTTSTTGSKTDGTYYKIFYEKMLKYYYAYGGTKTGYVTGNYRTTVSTPVYSTATRNGTKVTTIPIKTTVSVSEVSGDFGKVTYNGSTGWIYLQCAVCQNVVGANKVKYVKPVDNFAFTDTSVVQKDGIIYGVKENITGNALNAICTNNLKVLSVGGAQITTGYVGTGCKVQSLNANGGVVAEAIVIVKGDTDGDGQITSTDYTRVKAVFKQGKTGFDTYQNSAADVCENRKLTVSDYILIKRHVQKTFSIFK